MSDRQLLEQRIVSADRKATVLRTLWTVCYIAVNVGLIVSMSWALVIDGVFGVFCALLVVAGIIVASWTYERVLLAIELRLADEIVRAFKSLDDV